jgi:hypothetical protein
MATQVHNRSQRPRRHRVRRVTKAMCGHWLLVLVSHTVAIMWNQKSSPTQFSRRRELRGGPARCGLRERDLHTEFHGVRTGSVRD